MTKLLSAVSIVALCATPVLAQTADPQVDSVAQETSEAVEAAGNSVENAAEQTGDAIANAAGEAAEATENAAEKAGEMAGDAAQATENAAEAAGNEIEETAQDAAQATENAADEAEAEMAEGAAATTAAATGGAAMDDDDMARTGDALVLTSTFRASDLMGNNIYALKADEADSWGTETEIGDFAASYDNIGSIDDLLMDDRGQLVGVLAEVGGFLGIGDKLVVLGLDEIRVAVSDGEPYYVTRISGDQLEAREEVDDDIWDD